MTSSVAPQQAMSWGRTVTVLVFVATLAQLVVATFVEGLPQFEGKGFGARLIAYPALMLSVPVLWWWFRRRADALGAQRSTPPWSGFALLMAPFLIDVTGNTLNLYDSIGWWDDANHLVNWFLLSAGVGVLLQRSSIEPPWALGLLVAGLGALLAVGWELVAWFAFIRHGTELAHRVRGHAGRPGAGVPGSRCCGSSHGCVEPTRRAPDVRRC